MARGQVDYDQEADVLHVRLVPREQVARTHAMDEMRLIDYSADGAVLGVEFIDASGGIDLRDVPFARKVEKLIGDAGLGLRLFV